MQIENPAPEMITVSQAAWNALSAGLTCFLVLMVAAYQRQKEEFDFIQWLTSNVNRWLVGAALLIGLSTLTVLVPNISELTQAFGFNINAKVPISLGLGLAALLSVSTKSKPTVGG